MKSLLTILGTSLTLLGYAQSVASKASAITKEVERINISKHDVRSYPYSNTCGVIKATITIHYQNGLVQKISDIGVGDDDRAAAAWDYQYYYKNGALIFSKETKRYFDNEKNKEVTEEIREYLVSDRLIKQVKNQVITFPKNQFISQDDIRYRLKHINNASDVRKLYKCPDEP
ncbi:hypothetical protein [Taibaiella koreensis]|uniref:hypothetical protein n=1 Tax=Taibaiella koreensis TaxID=1268548 RepID=UPI0013C33091|nr:hypothetical protein [Taibaiella koreensis]